MKRRGRDRNRKGRRRRNPAFFQTLKPQELVQAAGDMVIMEKFGTFGLAITIGSPKLRDFLIRCATGVPDPNSVPTGTTEPASSKEGTNQL